MSILSFIFNLSLPLLLGGLFVICSITHLILQKVCYLTDFNRLRRTTKYLFIAFILTLIINLFILIY